MLAVLSFKPTNFLLRKVPPFCWLLPKQGEGPSRASLLGGHFKFKLIGTFSQEEAGEKKAKAASQKIITTTVQSYAGDPGYRETAKMLVESGLCLALDLSSCPGLGGCLTPSTALGLPLVERLRRAKIEFIVDEPKDALQEPSSKTE
eukprot:GHVT01094602.1.p1 GENE.GHVT01094602.1~~GHVT01094602.1.p1  ORF type:complete len:147 (-),score=36.38 GHVT01094602.1:663-1103(-)